MVIFDLFKARGRKKGSRGKNVKYIAIYVLMNGEERYIYPEMLQRGAKFVRDPKTGEWVLDRARTLTQVMIAKVKEAGGKIRSMRVVAPGYDKYLPAYVRQAIASPEEIEAAAAHERWLKKKPKVPSKKAKGVTEEQAHVRAAINLGDTKAILAQQRKERQRQHQAASVPEGEIDIHVAPTKTLTPIEADHLASAEVDPILAIRDLVLDRIEQKIKATKLSGLDDMHSIIPSVELSVYPKKMRDFILGKFDNDPHKFQEELRARPLTTLLTLGMLRSSTKGLPLLNKKEMAQLTSEWYPLLRDAISGQVAAFRQTPEYQARLQYDESKGRSAETKYRQKTKTQRYHSESYGKHSAVPSPAPSAVEVDPLTGLRRYGKDIPGTDVRKKGVGMWTSNVKEMKTLTKDFIDSMTAKYMAVAFDALRRTALNYEPEKAKSPTSSFKKLAFKNVQMDVYGQIIDELKDKHGLTGKDVNDLLPRVFTSLDIEEYDLAGKIRGTEQNPELVVEHAEAAARGRTLFFAALNALPETYRRIIALRYQVGFGNESGYFEDVPEGKQDAEGKRDFSDIAGTYSLWTDPRTGRTVNLGAMHRKAAAKWLIRREREATEAMRKQFVDRSGLPEEQSVPRNAPLTEEGKLVTHWLRLQTHLLQRQANMPATLAGITKPGVVRPKTRLYVPPSIARVEVEKTPAGRGLAFVQKHKAIMDRLKLAQARATLPNRDKATLARIAKLFHTVGVEGHLQNVRGLTVQPNVEVGAIQQISLNQLNKLYSRYKDLQSTPPDEIREKIEELTEKRKRLTVKLSRGEVEPHEARNIRQSYTNRIAIREFYLGELGLLKKAMTYCDLEAAFDDYDFETGRLLAA